MLTVSLIVLELLGATNWYLPNQELAKLEELRQQTIEQQEMVMLERALPVPQEEYRQTYFSVEEGETHLGAQISYTDNDVKVIDNVMHYKDDEFGYLQIVALDMNEITDSGLDSRGTWKMYGSVIEMEYACGKVENAIVLDACGACTVDNKIDLWVYNNQAKHDVSGVTYELVRDGWE